jgi:hypothetical protein
MMSTAKSLLQFIRNFAEPINSMFPASVLHPYGFLLSENVNEEDTNMAPHGNPQLKERLLIENAEIVANLENKIDEAKEFVLFITNQEPWPPETGGFASGCKFCGKPYPQAFSNADEHYENCIWVKAQNFLEDL